MKLSKALIVNYNKFIEVNTDLFLIPKDGVHYNNEKDFDTIYKPMQDYDLNLDRKNFEKYCFILKSILIISNKNKEESIIKNIVFGNDYGDFKSLTLLPDATVLYDNHSDRIKRANFTVERFFGHLFDFYKSKDSKKSFIDSICF